MHILYEKSGKTIRKDSFIYRKAKPPAYFQKETAMESAYCASAIMDSSSQRVSAFPNSLRNVSSC